MRMMLMAGLVIVASGIPAVAHQSGERLHLADLLADQQVEALRYCEGTYRVVTKEGEPFEFPEFNLRFKTDSSADGPAPGAPVVIPAGMQGDRAFVVFASPEDAAKFLKTAC